MLSGQSGIKTIFALYLTKTLCTGVAIMPLQLLELAVIIPRMFYKMFITRTPRGEQSVLFTPHIGRSTHKLCRRSR